MFMLTRSSKRIFYPSRYTVLYLVRLSLEVASKLLKLRGILGKSILFVRLLPVCLGRLIFARVPQHRGRPSTVPILKFAVGLGAVKAGLHLFIFLKAIRARVHLILDHDSVKPI